MAEESSARFSRTNLAHHVTSSPAGPTDGGYTAGERWKAVTGGMVADCVAVSCCPCAVVNLLTLALVKAPWKVARRCLGLGKKRTRSSRKSGRECVLVERGARLREAVGGGGAVSEFQAGFESETVWFELFQIGDLGFGRLTS